MVRTATRRLFYHVFINRNVKTKIFSCGHFYFIGCFSADKIVVAENRMITLRNRNNLIDDILHYLLTNYWTWLNLENLNKGVYNNLVKACSVPRQGAWACFYLFRLRGFPEPNQINKEKVVTCSLFFILTSLLPLPNSAITMSSNIIFCCREPL